MAIIAPQTAPNFATGEYHRILRAELVCPPGHPNPHWSIMVGFYASAYARENFKDPMWVNHVKIPLADLATDPRDGLYDLLMAQPLFAGTNARSDVAPTPAPTAAPT